MKKFILLFAILGMIGLPVFSATFTLKYGNNPVKHKDVYIFQDGRLVASDDTNYEGVVKFDLPTGNYSYRTSTNYSGEITASSVVTLDHNKLTVTIEDNANTPVYYETIKIYEDGAEVSSRSNNSNGRVEFYLKPSDKYAYKTSFNQAAFSLQNDLTLTLIKNSVSIIAKHKNYPVNDRFTLYAYGDKNESLDSEYSSSKDGEVNFNVAIGKYWIKNKLNIYTELDIKNVNQQFVLDYKKVRFISNAADPNVLEKIEVLNGRYGGDSKTTDGKGYADFYLLPGTYTYSHLGMSESFTVTDDMTINLTTQKVTFDLKNAVTLAPYGNQTFKVGEDMNSLIPYTTKSDGTCQVKLKAGDYIFSDGISSYQFTVSEGGQTITPPLYDVTFNVTQNLPNSKVNRLYVTSITTGEAIAKDDYANGMKMCLLSGDYKISCDGDGFSSGQYASFKLNDNISMQGFYAFQLKISDNTGRTISSQSYYLKQANRFVNASFVTNNQGLAIAYLPNGNYQLVNPQTQEARSFEISNQNKTLNLQLPNEVNLIVKKDGKALVSGNVTIYNEQKTATQSVQVVSGKAKLRIQAGSDYYIQLVTNGLVSMQSKVTVPTGDMTLDFVSLQIKTEGKGIAFPYQSEEDNTVYYLKNSSIRLAAVPMKGWVFSKWIINDANINDDLVDYTFEDATIATAVFEKNVPNSISQLNSANNNLTIYPNPVKTQINFSESLRGKAVIYNTEGRIMQQTYVYGNSVNVSDLDAGLYIITIEEGNYTYKGNFIKK